jgi:uncharacterized protein YcfJ
MAASANPFDDFKKIGKRIERNLKKSTKKMRNNPVAPIVGGIVGGVIASKVFDDNVVGIAIGVTAGAFIASELSNSLDENQRTHVTRSTVSTVATGKDQTWEDTRSKSRGSVRVVKTEELKQPVSVPVYKDKVTELPALDFIGETYEIVNNANVRGGPDTTFEKTGYFRAGSKVNVVGKVKESPWYFVSENGVGIGFVREELIRPSSSSIIAKQPEKATSDNIYEAEVAETKLCRTVEQSVTGADGTTKSEQMTACKGANGWEMQPNA